MVTIVISTRREQPKTIEVTIFGHRDKRGIGRTIKSTQASADRVRRLACSLGLTKRIWDQAGWDEETFR